MVLKNTVSAVFIFFLAIISLNFASSAVFTINGTTYDVNGNYLNSTNISIIIRNTTTWNQVSETSGLSNESGWFSFSLTSADDYGYQMTIIHKNLTYNYIDWVGKSLPVFPYLGFSQLSNIKFYLEQAGTLNISVVNKTNANIPTSQFAVQVKDTRLGYPIASCSNFDSISHICYVPVNRNYSVMVYPSGGSSQNFVPVSFNWNNFSATSSYNVTDRLGLNKSTYNATIKNLNKVFNVTESFARITGFVNASAFNIYAWENFTVIPFLLEPGNMMSISRGVLPWNISAWNNAGTDFYNLTNGFYNISVPYSPAETVNYLLFATAVNGTYYGSYRNITVSGNANVNVTMYGLLGETSSISMMNASMGTKYASTKRQMFNLVNVSSNLTFVGASGHIELDVDYTPYGALAFTIMDDLTGQGYANFSFPLLNVTGIKEINVYSSTFAPKRVSTKSVSQLLENSNISMKSFNPQAVSGSLGTVTLSAYRSNTTCDVPNPSSACLLNSFDASNPMKMLTLVIGGGAISLRMSYGGISVHYANVDLLASGPPDADFDSTQTESTSGSFSSAMKFGSNGPTIYDYVLVSIPYTEGSSSATGLNESAQVNMSIPTFYDESWATPIWSSSNGTNASAFAGNHSHYSERQSEWQALMTSSVCSGTASELNSSGPCHIDTANNKIWIRLPHFSGTQPSVTGGVITATSAPADTPSSGTTTSSSYWLSTYEVNSTVFSQGFAREMFIKYRIKTKINNEEHYVGLVGLTSSTATINVSSSPQQAVFNIGDEKKFDVTSDNYYDIIVKLISITGNKANLTFQGIYEKMSEEQIAAASSNTEQIQNNQQQSRNQLSAKTIIFIIIIAVIVIVAAFLIYRFYKRRYYSKGH